MLRKVTIIMASNKNYHFQVDLSNVPIKNNCYNWANSKNCIIPFVCDLFNGELRVIECIPKNSKNKLSSSLVIMEYKGIVLNPISTTRLTRGALHGILKDYLPKATWKYNIGDIINDENRNIKIIDRQIINGMHNYKILCLRCGFNSGKHYSLVNNVFKSEYWISEYRLFDADAQCPCCCVPSKIIVQGINDIATTAPWMIEYFVNKDDLLTHTCQSNKKVDMICPSCGKHKLLIIGNLYRRKYIPCVCDDFVSFPNKLAFYTLNSIPELKNYQREYSPNWVKPCRYDNYFTYNDKEYIIEMDGNIGHGKMKYKSTEKDVDGLQRDLLKDQKALEHKIKLYRIDCTSNNYDTIYDNLNFTLKNILGYFPLLDKQAIITSSTKNIVKEVCNYYSNVTKNQKQICDTYKISPSTTLKYLEQGAKYGWCDYKKISCIKEENKRKAVELYLENYSVDEIAKEMDLNYCTIRNYIKEADASGLCVYNSPEQRIKTYKKRAEQAITISSKRVYMYDINYNYIAQYKSVIELERNSLNDFGTELKSRCVGRVCLKHRRHYKGYIFSYTPLTNIS